jgi:hypothetical protein
MPPEGPRKELTTSTLTGISKEMILRVTEEGFEIDHIIFFVDAASGNLVLAKGFTALDVDEEEVKLTLGSAIAQDVPFYPDDEDAAEHLARLHSALYSDPVAIEENGKKRWIRWLGKRAVAYDDKINKWLVDPGSSLLPVDMMALAREASERQRSAVEAMRVIGALRAAIERLSQLLETTVREEQKLQDCLTGYPVLFGLQYRRVIPQHRLGGNFVMDFALELTSGLVDLVEIEPSSFRLYTRSGDPRKELVHAEQQVLDWLEWVETNARLVRDEFPGMMRPVGQVIIGRRQDLSEDDIKRLRQRNATWRGSLIILTYDDLLDRARNMLGVLTALGDRSGG